MYRQLLKSQQFTLWIIVLIVAFLLSFSIHRVIAKSQTPDDGIVVDFREFVFEQGLKEQIISDLKLKSRISFPGSRFVITSNRSYKNWILIDITSVDSPFNIDDESLGVGEARTTLIATKRSSEWELVFDFEDSFLSRLDKAPEELISSKAKQLLVNNLLRKEGSLSGQITEVTVTPTVGPTGETTPSPTPSTEPTPTPEPTPLVEYKFPWDKSEEWIWLDRGSAPVWHGGNCASEYAEYCAIDIGLWSRNRKRVLSSADGVIVGICRSDYYKTVNIVIEHADGKRLYYYHLDKVGHPEKDIQLYTEVKQGQFLGYLWEGSVSSDCGGAYAIQGSNFGHIHFVFPKKVMNFDGWLFNYPDEKVINVTDEDLILTPNDILPSTNSTLDNCIPYQNPWNVTTDCNFTTQSAAPGDIYVTSGATLTILPGAELKLDMLIHKLVVDPDSSVIVEFGGKLDSL